MASTFLRLFRYAKALGAEAKENFTTEALAAAVRADSAPLIEAIADVIGTCGPLVRLETQVSVKGAGIIDMVLTFDAEPDVWIEIKVDADESGQQLTNYREYLRALPQDRSPRLLVLGPQGFHGGPWVSWQSVHDAIGRNQSTVPYWLDFRTYLEEIKMADTYGEPVTPSEARALLPARHLLGKLTRVLTAFAVEARRLQPKATWKESEDATRTQMLEQFVKHEMLSIFDAAVANNVGVSAGVYHEPTTDDVRLGVWIWINPKRVKERLAILTSVERTTWDDDWQRYNADWEIWAAYRPLVAFENNGAATTWLVTKYRQLMDAGLLDQTRSFANRAAVIR